MLKVKLPNFFRHSWRLYVITLVFVTLASMLFWLDFFRAYKAEISVLVIGRTPMTSTDLMVENFVALPKSLTFYERILARNPRLEEGTLLEKSENERRKEWNSLFSAERSEKSGVLVLTIKSDEAEKARTLVKEAAQELFSMAGFYYNVKTDVDMRVVDGPVVKTTVAHPIAYVAVSVASSLIFVTLFFWILHIIPVLLGKREEKKESLPLEGITGEKAYPEFKIGDSVPLIDPKKFIPKKPTALSYETSSEEEKEEISQEIVPVSSNLPVAAPEHANLPVALEELPFEFEAREEEVSHDNEESVPLPQEGSESIEKEKKVAEPTAEEYKRRLNELLRGGK